jgi:hypothetical protein
MGLLEAADLCVPCRYQLGDVKRHGKFAEGQKVVACVRSTCFGTVQRLRVDAHGQEQPIVAQINKPQVPKSGSSAGMPAANPFTWPSVVGAVAVSLV